MTWIKLCGITRVEEVQAVNRLKPDAVGFVFYPSSRRYVSARQAAVLRSHLDPEIATCGVFVQAPIEEITDLAAAGTISCIQLHGQEDSSYIQDLRSSLIKSGCQDIPLIQAVVVRSRQDLKKAAESPADLVLLDAGMGDGKTLDWECLKDIKRPYILAGGLQVQNVDDALNTLHPFGVDVSSGIEKDGHKDEEKMTQFVWKVRHSDRESGLSVNA